jgi:asparagine synthase (glutamine-hydrolysing)
MLSGGLDSTTVATIVSQAAGRPIDTFTVGFEDNSKYSELAYARETARRIGSRHHEVEVSSRTYKDFLPLSIEHLEEPVATGSTLAFYEVCRLASQHVKVVLTGQGADEPFAGYDRYLGERYSSLYRTIPAIVRSAIVKPLINLLPRNEQLKRAAHSLGIRDDLERMSSIYSIVDAPLKKALYREDLGLTGSHGGRDAIRLWNSDIAARDPVNRMLYIDSRLSLSDNLLLYGDKMSMAVSLEARVPFLDLELMEFVESIPSALKIRGLVQKYILKKAVTQWVPPEVIKRKKVAFATPLDEWFRAELYQELRDRFGASDSACRAFFNIQTVNRILEDHRAQRHDYKRILFSLLTFEIWHEIFIRGRRVTKSPPASAPPL